jgi:hypothetical protein
MNRTTGIIATTIAIIGLSACTPAQIKQFLNRTPTVVNHRSTVVTPLLRNETTVTTYVVDIGTPAFPVLRSDAPCGETGGSPCSQPPRPCGETGGADCPQPSAPQTTVPSTDAPCGETGGPDCQQQQAVQPV